MEDGMIALLTRRVVAPLAALALLALSGCVAYPDPYYGGGYYGGYGYAPAPAYVGPTVVVGGGWWGWHGHHWH
jgi:hypothetical protein